MGFFHHTSESKQAGKKFDGNDEGQEEVMMWFEGLAADFYDSGIQKLAPRLNPLATELNPICKSRHGE